jgi:hypothetical protein
MPPVLLAVLWLIFLLSILFTYRDILRDFFVDSIYPHLFPNRFRKIRQSLSDAAEQRRNELRNIYEIYWERASLWERYKEDIKNSPGLGTAVDVKTVDKDE